MAQQNRVQLRVPQPGTLTGCRQQNWLQRGLVGVPRPSQPCPGCLVLIGTHLTASIFLLKAEERIVSTIIPQRYIFQLYLELDTAVTLLAIASTPAPAVMNLKPLAPQQQRESLRRRSRARRLQPCRAGSQERDRDDQQTCSAGGPGLMPTGVVPSSRLFSPNPTYFPPPTQCSIPLPPSRLIPPAP